MLWKRYELCYIGDYKKVGVAGFEPATFSHTLVIVRTGYVPFHSLNWWKDHVRKKLVFHWAKEKAV